MEIVGLEPRRSDLARGIVIARSKRPLDAAQQRQLWQLLASASVTEPSEVDDPGSEPPRQWHAAPWLPPTAGELGEQRAALEQAATELELEGVWLVKVETGIDGVAWLELTAGEAAEAAAAQARAVDPADAPGPGTGWEEMVLYEDPDAADTEVPAVAEATEDDADDDDEDDEDDDDIVEAVALESHWRNGTPPFEHTVTFPIERYPEIIDDYDWESFGVALKLSGDALLGEESVINAFFALWLSVYQDERADEFEPFSRADAIHDRRHRSSLMWVERFAVPATSADQVHFLLWIIARLSDIIPIAWVRFDTVDDATKSHASGDGEAPFVLAGNPFADRFRRQGEEAALAWAVGQSAWSKRELAGMLVEVALEHDPDDPSAAAIAERLLRRARAFDPACDAAGYLAIVLIRQDRVEEAIALARTSKQSVRLLVIGEAAEHAPDEVGPALSLLDDAAVGDTTMEELADLAGQVARHAPEHLAAILEKLPNDVLLVPHLYNSSFGIDRPQALQILRRVIALPEPAKDTGEARTALVMAWNNACIHAHALGDYKLAADLASGGQRFGPENPYIYHSAACAYAALGQIDKALEQVSKAIEHEYEHTEKMETDADLSPLQRDPRFPALFNEWRTRRADLN